MTIAYQGAPGAFSEEAARAFGGGAAALAPLASFEAVFDALARRDADRAALPIENTLAGTVRDVARLLATRDVAIEAEARIHVSHALLGVPGATPGAIRRVRSHPVALQQCERWFRAHPAVEPVAAFDTAGAVAEIVREGDPTVAALAAERAAELHGAVVLARELEDDPANWTRFLLLARAGEATLPPAGVPHKLALAFRAAHQPGSLWRCLGVFAERALDLTRIESHPVVGRPFEYEFMVDVVGPGDSPALDDALAALRVHCTHVRQLGRYASAPA